MKLTPIKYCGCCGYATIYLDKDQDWCGYCKRHPPGKNCDILWREELESIGAYDLLDQLEAVQPHEIDPNGGRYPKAPQKPWESSSTDDE